MMSRMYTIAAVVLCAMAIYIFIFSFARLSRFCVRFLLRAGAGLCVLSAFNAAAATYGLCIGLNVYTFSFCGLLGLPGYILLLATQVLF